VPLLSAFTPMGVLRMSSAPSEVEKIYRSLVASLGEKDDNYSTEPGSRMDAWCYAMARCLGVVRLTLIHAGKQIEADCVTEFMGDRELEWRIVPGPFDTLIQRRNTLASRKVLPRGARREAVIDAATKLLGSNFVWYRTTKPSEIVTWPVSAGAQPQNFQLPTVPRKLLQITQPVDFNLGQPQAVNYAIFDEGESVPIVNDVLVVDPADYNRAERVTVTAVSPGTFTATFNEPHNPNTLATTSPFPAWVSTQRFNMVILSAAAAIDPETRRKLHELAERIFRGISTWGIVQQTGPGTAGPFEIGISPLGATPLGTIAFP
jgi:hypothetical protein